MIFPKVEIIDGKTLIPILEILVHNFFEYDGKAYQVECKTYPSKVSVRLLETGTVSNFKTDIIVTPLDVQRIVFKRK